MIATSSHLDYPWGTNPRVQNSMLTLDTGNEVEFNMLYLIMFDSTPGSGNGNNFEPRKRYRAPCARTKKREGKRGILAFGTNI